MWLWLVGDREETGSQEQGNLGNLACVLMLVGGVTELMHALLMTISIS